MNKFLNDYFEIEKRGSTIKKEIIAGIIIFFSMSYILIIMPLTFSEINMDAGAVFTATALSAFFSTILMGLYAKYPVALAPGMGTQAFFAYVIVIANGFSWQEGLFAIFVSGLLFVTLSITGLRNVIISVVPKILRTSVTIGIGLFIAFIGMQNAGIIVSDEATVVALGDLSNPTVVLALIGVMIIFILHVRKVNGALFIGLLSTIVLGIIMQLLGLEMGVTFPTSIVSTPPSIEPIFGQLFKVDIIGLLTSLSFWVIVLSVLFVDFFDTTGTIMAIGTEAGTVDEEGNIIDADKVLLVDSLGTTVGAIFGVSSVTSYIESLSGVKYGGRTGLTAVVVAIGFLLSLFFSPLLLVITSSMTAPILITLGVLMAMNHDNIDYSNFTDSATVFMTSILMLLTYSISIGLAFGMITYTILKTVETKKALHPLLYILSMIFIVYLVTT